jgi:UDPglucose--hexose-1-phosphate uridylyltransferase
MTRETRIDPHTGTVVHIVAARQSRPNLPTSDCPFCVGGLEASDAYTTKSFPNRWPALDDGYCEVVLYSPDHDASLATLPNDSLTEIVDLWAERTTALRAHPKGEYVVVFENRGAEIGATIPHPHGQIYAFDHVPQRTAQYLNSLWTPEENPSDRLVLEDNGWRVWCEFAAVHPVSIRVAPVARVADLPSLSNESRTTLARVLGRVMRSLDTLFDESPPYMLWWNQAPRSAHDWPDAWLNLEIVSPWRATGVPRYIAGVEIATGEYFNPVDPADVAARMREALTR